MTRKSVSYQGHSTDFIPLPSKTGHDETLFGPGDPVLARYPSTRVFPPGICHFIEPVSIKIYFVGDEDGKSRDVSPQFVIPWKAQSSRDSVNRGPLLVSFCFTIGSIRPDYTIQSRRFGCLLQTCEHSGLKQIPVHIGGTMVLFGQYLQPSNNTRCITQRHQCSGLLTVKHSYKSRMTAQRSTLVMRSAPRSVIYRSHGVD